MNYTILIQLKPVLIIIVHYNIANRIGDNENRILLHQTLEELSYMLNDDSLAVTHKNKAIEIERAMKGLPPDFSDYNFSFNLKQHDNLEDKKRDS